MFQAGSGNTTTHQLPRRFWYAVIATVAWWNMTAVAAILDITDGFPRGLIALAAAGAGTLTIGTMFIHAGAKQAELVEALGRLEAARARDREALRKTLAEAVAMAYRRGLAQAFATVANRAANGGPVPETSQGLDRTEYWQVYSDVMRDLGGLGTAEDGGTGPLN